MLAELLGWAHSTIIMQVEVTGSEVRVKRELEAGWFQHIVMPLPAVLTIQSGISKLRYASLMGIKKAKTKEVRRLTLADLQVQVGSRVNYRARLSSAKIQADTIAGRACRKKSPPSLSKNLSSRLAFYDSGFRWSVAAPNFTGSRSKR